MRVTGAKAVLRATIFLAAGAALTACTTAQQSASLNSKATAKTAKVQAGPQKQVYAYTTKDRECLKRAMYFESQRTSESGLLAVGSVIMNRLTSGMYAPTICGVVGQKNQFAPGVMTRRMDEATAPELDNTADAVLKGARHPDVKEAMFFHRAGLRFGYDNMHYVADAGGNEFYEKRDENGQLQTAEPKRVEQYVMAFAQDGARPTGFDAIVTPPTAPQNTPAVTAGAAPTIYTAQAQPQQAPAAAAISVAAAPVKAPVAGPVITAEIAKAGVEQTYDTAYAVPQNSSVSQAQIFPASMTAAIPTPAGRPESVVARSQKRPSAGIAVAGTQAQSQSAISYDNWAMRTGSW